MATDVGTLFEGTGASTERRIRTGEDHFSLAFTYAWMAASRYMDAPEVQIVWI